MKKINSKVFGNILLLDENEEDYIKLKELVDKYPSNAFGIINKKMNTNTRGFSLVLIIPKEG